MHRGNRRLQAIRPGVPAAQAALHQGATFLDHVLLPQRTVLLVQQDQLTSGRDPRRAPGLVQQHQRQQAHHLRLGQQLQQQVAQADGFAGQLISGQLGAHGGRVALVEYQVDHPQHALQALGQFTQLRHLIGNPGVADLRLGAHDALGDGGRADQPGPGDFLGAQVADLAQGQRHLGIGRQCRVAAGEDQAQAVILHILDAPVVLFQLLQLAEQRRLGSRETRPSAQGIDRLEAADRHQPGPGVVGHASVLPALDGHEEGLVQRLFGQVEIPQQADQGGEDPPRLLAVDQRHLRR